MIKIVSIVFILLNLSVASAQKLITRNGEIKFEASMPTFEEISGKNSSLVMTTSSLLRLPFAISPVIVILN